MHVHIATSEGVAKFWLEPIIALAGYHDVKPQELRKIEEIIREREHELKSAWRKHLTR